jgi:hypothetical protein
VVVVVVVVAAAMTVEGTMAAERSHRTAHSVCH